MTTMDPLPALTWKLWIYTNYDCNLSCSYCVAESTPRAARNAIGLENAHRLSLWGSNSFPTNRLAPPYGVGHFSDA